MAIYPFSRYKVDLGDSEACFSEVAAWQIVQAWPVKYIGSEFNVITSELAIEQLELAHEGVTRIK